MINKTVDSPEIKLLKKDLVLRSLIDELGIIELNKRDSKNGFKYLVDSIVGQQLSVKAADSIIKKIEGQFGSEYDPIEMINYDLNLLRTLGVSRKKGLYIHGLANEVLSGNLDFYRLEKLSNEDVIQSLTYIKGIGSWTAKMYLIFVLARKDVFPSEDKAFTQEIRSLYQVNESELKEKLKELKGRWNPYESYAALYIWKKRDSS